MPPLRMSDRCRFAYAASAQLTAWVILGWLDSSVASMSIAALLNAIFGMFVYGFVWELCA